MSSSGSPLKEQYTGAEKKFETIGRILPDSPYEYLR
jgi:hypothetical protein